MWNHILSKGALFFLNSLDHAMYIFRVNFFFIFREGTLQKPFSSQNTKPVMLFLVRTYLVTSKSIVLFMATENLRRNKRWSPYLGNHFKEDPIW